MVVEVVVTGWWHMWRWGCTHTCVAVAWMPPWVTRVQ